MIKQRIIKHIALPILLFVSMIPQVFATTVLQVDLDHLLTKAMLIFEGEVVASEAQWSDDKTTISTFITFTVNEIIKGELQGSTLTLEFSGGTVGETGLHVGSLVYPLVGEKGIYFMENPGKRFVNPLLGWGQGHFRIKIDDHGMERVFTEKDSPVLNLDFTRMAGAGRAKAGRPPALPISHGVARGVLTGAREEPMASAMGKTWFIDALKAHLETIRSNTESISGSAGGNHEH